MFIVCISQQSWPSKVPYGLSWHQDEPTTGYLDLCQSLREKVELLPGLLSILSLHAIVSLETKTPAYIK